MTVQLKCKGDWSLTKKLLGKFLNMHNRAIFEYYGQLGVEALEEATPKRTGKTAASWSYVIEEKGDKVILYWTNDNKTKDGDMIAVLIQFGHATRRGGYVQGRDYINPAIRPIFDDIADKLWKVVKES